MTLLRLGLQRLALALELVDVAVSGIMISGWTSTPSLATRQAASKMARTCIRVSSGIMMPRRTPRRPSIGLASSQRLGPLEQASP